MRHASAISLRQIATEQTTNYGDARARNKGDHARRNRAKKIWNQEDKNARIQPDRQHNSQDLFHVHTSNALRPVSGINTESSSGAPAKLLENL
jgi:hypothetical protein